MSMPEPPEWSIVADADGDRWLSVAQGIWCCCVDLPDKPPQSRTWKSLRDRFGPMRLVSTPGTATEPTPREPGPIRVAALYPAERLTERAVDVDGTIAAARRVEAYLRGDAS